MRAGASGDAFHAATHCHRIGTSGGRTGPGVYHAFRLVDDFDGCEAAVASDGGSERADCTSEKRIEHAFVRDECARLLRLGVGTVEKH